MSRRPVPTLVLILDGWGKAPDGPGNAVSLAETPNLDRLQAEYPATTLLCSGRAVGLPDGFMGNSEVGHMNLGAGRVIYQDMTRIDLAIEQGEFEKNATLIKLMDAVKAKGGRLHAMGLVSDGGVHSHINHVRALVRMAKARGVELLIDAYLDGRDTPPTSGQGYVRDLQEFLDTERWGRIAMVSGRYWAMDRDKHWERNKHAYDALTQGLGAVDGTFTDAVAAIGQAYDAGETDEFVKPRVMADASGAPVGVIRDGDGVFFFNFRADRAKQLTLAFISDEFPHFERQAWPQLAGFASMTMYDGSFGVDVAFPPQDVAQTLGQAVSELGLAQLRIAETEKYAHVTYFLNCGQENPFANEERELIPSPREVATYDLKPEMSCPEVTEKLLGHWNSGRFDLVVCNLANLDMVGHTGIIPAAIAACETVDASVGRIAEAVLARGGRMLLTADHGNAEEMLDASGGPQTAHSLNPVPLVLVEQGRSKDNTALAQGALCDVAPTVFGLWGLAKPEVMAGTSLVNGPGAHTSGRKDG